MRRTHLLRGLLIGCLGMLFTCQGLPARAATKPHHPHWLGRTELTPRQPQRGATTPPGNFPFQTAHSADGLVTLHYYQQLASYATQVLGIVATVLQHPIRDTLGYALIHPVDIFAYNSRADFLAGAAVSNPAETGAYSVFSPPQIYLPITNPASLDTVDTLAHELTHIVFNENESLSPLQSYIRFYPLWLDEGLAAYDESVQPSAVAAYNDALTFAVNSNTLISLIDTFDMNYPTDPNTDFLGYAEAQSFIKYLHDRYGATLFHQFIASLHDGQIWLVATRLFHASPRILQQEWEASLGAKVSNAVGYTPALSIPTPFATGTTPALAARTQPLALAGGGAVARGLLTVALEISLFTTLFFMVAFLAARRSAPRRAQSRPPASITILESYRAQNAPSEAPSDIPSSTGESTAVAREAPAVRTLTAVAPIRRLPRRPLFARSALILFCIAPLLLWGLGMLGVLLNPRHEWAQGILVAKVASAVIAAALSFLFIRLLRSQKVLGGMLIVALFALLVSQIFVAAPDLAQDQAGQYATLGAYALAVQTYRDAGETSGNEVAAAQVQWAQAALAAKDYATAVIHLRAALQARPDDSIDVRATLLTTVQQWGMGLTNAQHFADAVQVYSDQSHFALCDASCQAAMTTALSTTYRAWGDQLLASGQYAAAQSEYTILKQTYGTTSAATNVALALQECAAQPLLAQALLAGQQGNSVTMNADLHTLVQEYPHTAAASEAGETPQPVSGVIQDSSGRNPAGARLFFAGYASRSDAINFNATNAVMVATTIGANGAFTVRLQPGYWYLPFWEDPTFALGNVNTSLASNLGTFYVAAYTPISVGTLVGF